jgi:hypothetical protein
MYVNSFCKVHWVTFIQPILSKNMRMPVPTTGA